MAGFTADGQLRGDLRDARDQRFGLSSTAERERRAGIPDPPLDRAADQGFGPDAPQVQLRP